VSTIACAGGVRPMLPNPSQGHGLFQIAVSALSRNVFGFREHIKG
jgi:hypothetical protein